MGQREGNLLGRAVELGRLMGILAVAERLHQIEIEEQFLGQARLRTHVGGDHAVVLRRMGVGLGRKTQTRFDRSIALGAHLVQNRGVVRRIADDGHVAEILGRTAQHRRAADVDVLDRFGQRNALFGDRLAEGIEVHADQIDELDAVGAQRLDVLLDVAARQQTAVHGRMKRLHAPVANLGEARHVADVQHLDTALAQQFHRAARGDHLPAQSLQILCEVDDARLIADTYQCPHFSYFMLLPIYQSFPRIIHAPPRARAVRPRARRRRRRRRRAAR